MFFDRLNYLEQSNKPIAFEKESKTIPVNLIRKLRILRSRQSHYRIDQYTYDLIDYIESYLINNDNDLDYLDTHWKPLIEKGARFTCSLFLCLAPWRPFYAFQGFLLPWWNQPDKTDSKFERQSIFRPWPILRYGFFCGQSRSSKSIWKKFCTFVVLNCLYSIKDFILFTWF